jgi:uncharacterized membrane protein YeaQ/YmgE (transglycosylase-associated protein family)
VSRTAQIAVVVVLAVIAALVLAWVVVGFIVDILLWALIGLAIGAIARFILPGKQELSILATAGAGISAALLGGVVAWALDLGTILQYVIAVVLAVVLVAVIGGTRYARI